MICPLLGKKELRKKKTNYAVTIAEIKNNRPVTTLIGNRHRNEELLLLML